MTNLKIQGFYMNTETNNPQLVHPIREDQVKSFQKNGFLILENFLNRSTCAQLASEIMDFKQKEEVISVKLKKSEFSTFNGFSIDENFPSIAHLYDKQVLEIINSICITPIATVQDRRIGLSVNLTSNEGKFQPHFDRNLMTAVLYVNEEFEGGQMQLFPRIRFLIKDRQSNPRRFFQKILDKLVCHPLYLNFVAQKIEVIPSAGNLLIFEGSRSLHEVKQVRGNNLRISIQFAYDIPETSYDIKGYYGLKNKNL